LGEQLLLALAAADVLQAVLALVDEAGAESAQTNLGKSAVVEEVWKMPWRNSR
jgi:hypothetical protein